MKRIRYSVVVPAYNAGKNIDKCLTALAGQTLHEEEYEIIVVDDGSSDSTPDMAKSYPVIYIRQENKGPAAARNLGAKQSSGEIILFTDSDCVPEADWISEMVRPFSDPDVIAVKGAYKTEQSSLTARFAQLEFEERFELLKKSASIDMIDTYSAAFRRDVFWKAGGFDESFPVANNEDTDLSYKLSRLGHKMVFNPNAVVYHLNHPDSLRRYARLKFWRGYWRMIVYKRYPDKIMRDSYTPQSLKFQILFVFLFLMFSSLLWVFPRALVYPGLISFTAFLSSCVSFTISALKRDFVIGVLSPFYLLVRAVSLGSGTLYGVIRPMKYLKVTVR